MLPYMLKHKIDSSQTSSVLGRNGEGVVAIKQLSGASSIYFTQLPVEFLPGVGVKSECEVKVSVVVAMGATCVLVLLARNTKLPHV